MNESPDPRSTAREISRRYGDRPDTLLEILHDIQAELRCIPEGVVTELADSLNLSRADVHGVISFYHDFRREPGGQHRLRICRAEACQAMGGETLARQASETLGIGFGETTRDGETSLETVYCLGNCALAPAAELNGELIGRLDDARLAHLIRQCRAGESS